MHTEEQATGLWCPMFRTGSNNVSITQNHTTCVASRCGKRKGEKCRHAANEAKRQGDELWAYLTGGHK